MNACILTCSSLTEFVQAAQRSQGTALPVYEVDRKLHAEPGEMRMAIAGLIASLDPRFDTVLVAMGFCGGAWDHVRFDRWVVIPRVDDCVSLLLQTDDEFCPNRKEPGHLYLFENDPKDFSALTLLRDFSLAGQEYKDLNHDYLFHMWFDSYRHMDIIDTGFNDCYSVPYVEAAQQEADKIHAELDYVPGSNRILEKLVSGSWDDQFLVAEPGHELIHGDFFG